MEATKSLKAEAAVRRRYTLLCCFDFCLSDDELLFWRLSTRRVPLYENLESSTSILLGVLWV